MLTPRQRQTYRFIKAYIEEHEYAPTIAEIGKALGVKSRSMVQRILTSLEQEEMIRRLSGVKRNIELVNQAPAGVSMDAFTLPLMGRIAAGQPIEAIPNPEQVNLQAHLIKQDRFLLQVKGDSMNGDYICDGDWVVCEPCQQASAGSIIIALVDQAEVTLKRIYYNVEKTLITLEPSNRAYAPQTYEANRVSIQGLYVGLVRINRQ